MPSLQNKVVLVTGGGSGIGLATVRLLMENGAKVAAAGRDHNKLAANTKEFAKPDRLFLQAADVADPAQVQQLVQKVIKQFGRIDILVNCAGTNIKNRAFRELTPESWQQLIRTNLDGAFYCIHAVLPGMLERRDGFIININSTSGLRAHPLGGVAYAASKFGMTALGIGLGFEEKDAGIRVTNIYPGEVDTPILQFRKEIPSAEHRSRILKPEDVAGAVLFVASQPTHVSIPELTIKPTSQGYV
jgi:NADP-dependent 3-hydroxy acid dehydrogenase YdfG